MKERIMKHEDYDGKFVKVKCRYSTYKTYDDYTANELKNLFYIEKDEIYLLKTSYSGNETWPIMVEIISSDMQRLYNGCKDVWLEDTFDIIG